MFYLQKNFSKCSFVRSFVLWEEIVQHVWHNNPGVSQKPIKVINWCQADNNSPGGVLRESIKLTQS